MFLVLLWFFLSPAQTVATKHSIESIRFNTTMCFGKCPVFALLIQADGHAFYTARKFNKPDGNFEGTISPKVYAHLMTLLDKLDFPNLENNFNVNWTDDQTSILTITYDNGKTKRIRDYGLAGTDGLRKVYKLLFDCRHTQSWKHSDTALPVEDDTH